MKSARAILAAFIAAVLAVVFALARRVSKKTGKGLTASLPDVPGEAQRLASDVKSRATETVSGVKARTTEAVTASVETIRAKEAAIKERIVGDGHPPEPAPEAAEADVTWAAEGK